MDRIQVGNLAVAVSDAGDGPPVVLLHGLACGKRMWFHQIRALRRRFRVIAYDLRGHGQTDAPAVATEYSAAHLARDLVGVLDALDIKQAAIVGFSLGGGPALALAASKPERVSRLVLADVGAGADDPVKIEGMARRWGALIGQGEIDELVCDMLRSELFKVYARRSPRRREHMAALIRATPIDGLRFTLSEVLAKRKSLFRLSGVLKSVRAPTLVMVGELDYVCSKASRLMAQAIPGATLKIIKNSGHMSPIEQPAAFTAALMEFLGWRRNLPSRRVTLHAARIGGGAAARADAGRGGEAAFRPVRADLDLVAAALELVDGLFRHAAFDHQQAGMRGARPERAREMLGMPGRRVDRFLHIHAGVDMTQEELRDPLILAVAAGRAPGEVRLAVAQRHRR